MNNGLSTLQFQSLSVSAQRPQNLLQGGTQDNGTFQYNGSPRRLAADHLRRRRPVRLQRRQRQAALQHVHRPGERRELPRRRPDEVGHHLGADPVEPGGVVLLSADHRGPASGDGGLDLPGLVLRLADAGLGRRPGVPRSELPRVHDLGREARLRRLRPHRPGRAVDGPDGARRAGTVGRRRGRLDPASTAPSNTGTMWAATSTGRVFVTDNANDAGGLGRLEPARPVGAERPGALHQRDLRRSGEPASRVDFVHRATT